MGDSNHGAIERWPALPTLPDRVTREAYSHEVSSAGFWPGSAAMPAPMRPFEHQP